MVIGVAIPDSVEKAANHLSHFYEVAMGAALSVALFRIFTEVDERWDRILNISELATLISSFVIFLSLFIPFLHGNIMLLYKHYVHDHTTDELPNDKSGRILVDFYLLIFQAIIFIFMGMFLFSIEIFISTAIFLLILDVIFFFFITSHFGRANESEYCLVYINCIFILVFFVLFAGFEFLHTPLASFMNGQDHDKTNLEDIERGIRSFLYILIAVAAIVRTVCDYHWCKDIYLGRFDKPSEAPK